MEGDFDDLGWIQPDGFTYVWVESQAHAPFRPDPALMLVQPASAKFRSYKPLDVDGLFLTFAETEPTPEAVLDFASRYGPLGNGIEEPPDTFKNLAPLSYPHPVHLDGTEDGLAEGFFLWREQIQWMRLLTDLWGYAAAGEQSALKQFLRWDGDAVVFEWEPIEVYQLEWGVAEEGLAIWEAGRFRGRDGRPLVRKGDLVAPALRFVQRHLDDRLRHTRTTPRLVWPDGADSPRLLTAPARLLDSLWLQFALSVADRDRGFRIVRCVRCGKRIELAPGVNRADRTTCSDSCRSLLYRRRKKQAVAMQAEGKTPKQIADALGSDVDTVKGWLRASKMGGK